MGLRDYVHWAATQYGVDPGVLAGMANRESTWNPNAHNGWDSNAAAGIPSHGLMQFIQPTFNDFAKQARAAKPQLWEKFGNKLNWKDPYQQSLTAAWAVKNGKGSHWATYNDALQDAKSYNYKPTWRLAPGGSTANPTVNPMQAAQVAGQSVAPTPLTNEQKNLLAAPADLAGSDLMPGGRIDSIKSMLENQASMAAAQQQFQQPGGSPQSVPQGGQNPNAISPHNGFTFAENQQRKDLVGTALGEVGTVTAEAMQYIKAAGGTGQEPWCGDFVQWVFKQKGLKPPPARSVPTLLNWAKGNGTFGTSGHAGDLVMFDWNHDGTPDHVGIMRGQRGNQIWTVEGNTSGSGGTGVWSKWRDPSTILGYVNYNY